MKQNNKNNKSNPKKQKEVYTKTKPGDVPVLKNPMDSKWGKIIIWLLIFGFAGLMIVSLILALVLK